jgi:biopolymer transport protein ExbD
MRAGSDRSDGEAMTGGLRKYGRRAAPIVDINMVPFIDVVLVLLIVFMVLTPFLVQQQLKINIPQSVAGHVAPDRPIVITVQGEGSVGINGRPIAVNQLEEELRALAKADSNRPVVIQADEDIALQRVVSIMDIVKRANISKLGISVEQPK